jgi:integrase
MFNLARKWEIPGAQKNPTDGIPLFELNNARERYLTREEAQRLFEAVKTSPQPMLQHIFAFLILTGARRREVLDAKWEDIEVSRRHWRISMTKSGKPRNVPLSEGALRVLELVPRLDNCPWIFPNIKTLKPFVGMFVSWDTARKKAGLADVRMHDLRHSFASFLVNSGRSLYEVQQLLGHTQIKTTQRYSHLAPETLLAATDAVTRAVSLDLIGGIGHENSADAIKTKVMFCKKDIEQEADGRWIAEVSTLPGVMTYGTTAQEAIRNVIALAEQVTIENSFEEPS